MDKLLMCAVVSVFLSLSVVGCSQPQVELTVRLAPVEHLVLHGAADESLRVFKGGEASEVVERAGKVSTHGLGLRFAWPETGEPARRIFLVPVGMVRELQLTPRPGASGEPGEDWLAAHLAGTGRLLPDPPDGQTQWPGVAGGATSRPATLP